PLHKPAHEHRRAVLAAQQRGDTRGNELAEERRTGLADNESDEHPCEEPHAAVESLQTRKKRLQRGGDTVVGDVPDEEDDTARHRDDARDDDIDNAPAVTAL